ncbi:hypothetical protein GJ744_005124 [Endocarpon pusillum]|uniref:Mannose-6-phosphate isomerase n=1 Tax=Endocarpon pusillum TaxID=364733 RepID=A0A8H7E6L4_9EURO|nr:hypothetical protein GJ744_005124 [Endocarpon pusillum]
MAGSVLQLKCDCNNYPWGKKGHHSLAARLCEKTSPDFKIDDDKEYSEMWMGTYPVIPSHVLSTGENLQDVINANAESLMGKRVLDKFGKDLPFLPKVLSIAKALPLQIHPSKPLSEQLHKKDPEKFTDPNHKPEIAVALTDFEVFVNFKPLADIQSLLKVEPLTRFLPSDATSSLTKDALKQVCKTMLSASPETVADVQSSLSKLSRSQLGSQAYILDLLSRLQQQYTPEDNGTLIALICMNYLQLKPGQAIYVPADGIHAYLSGDIVECMARSNNVINTGFCPRADRDDMDLFTEALTFNPQKGEEALLVPRQSERGRQGRTKIFQPPMSEFDMLLTELDAGQAETVSAVDGPSIMFVMSGKGTMKADEAKTAEVGMGHVYFVGRGVELEFQTHDHDGLVVYRAFAE